MYVPFFLALAALLIFENKMLSVILTKLFEKIVNQTIPDEVIFYNL